MLKGISPVISPDLLKALAEMGHGDELVLADAHFPGHSVRSRPRGHSSSSELSGPVSQSSGLYVLRADGVTVTELLAGIMPLFALDTYEDPLIMMQAVPGDEVDPAVERDYLETIRAHEPMAKTPRRLERHVFYERAQRAYAIVVTGELRKYGNIILKKGVTPR